MRSRRLPSLVLIIALWGCSGGTSVPPPSGQTSVDDGDGRIESWDMHAQTFHTQIPFDPMSKTPAGQDEWEVLILATKEMHRQPRPIEIPRGGSLNTRLQDKLVPLPLKHTDVKAQLTLFVGAVTVTQQYHNPYRSKIEAVYTFPLPDDAGVRDFMMQIGERRIRGIVRERKEAERIYVEARRQGHVASLLTQDRPNIFTQAVANIEPGKQIDVQITYFHTLRYQDGTFEFVFPMVVGPRYTPGGYVETVPVEYLKPNEISAADIALEASVDGGMDFKSPTHAIRVDGTKVTLSPNDRIPNRDFVLRYRLANRALLATTRDASGGYFALMLQPPEKLADVPRTPREMIFVVDCSGSMSGRPLDVAKRALVKCLKRLEPDDTFQILRFSDHVSAMGPAPVAATPENVQRGLRYAESLSCGGGTEMQEVVRVALDYPVGPGRFRLVSFMTDGYIGNDREVVAFAREHLGSARIFSFGVGDSVNRYLLEALARVGRGASTFITLDESTERAADELYQRVEHPALTDLKIDWGAMGVNDVQPQPLPDLFVGRPVLLTGRFKGQGPARIQLIGRSGDRPLEMALDVNLDEPGLRHAALAAVWARTKITSLHDRALGSADPREVVDEIRRVALQYGLMSEGTSFVAVDSLTRSEGTFGTTLVQPVPVPSGVRYETTVEKK